MLYKKMTQGLCMYHAAFIKMCFDKVWWCMPVIPAQGRGQQVSITLRPAQPTQQVPGQPRVHNDPLSQNLKSNKLIHKCIYVFVYKYTYVFMPFEVFVRAPPVSNKYSIPSNILCYIKDILNKFHVGIFLVLIVLFCFLQ